MPEIDYSSGGNPSDILNAFWVQTLSDIKNGRWGSDIRTPIYDGIVRLLTEKEISEQTIEEDLALIAGSIYGEEIRMAIYDALQKIHEEGSSGEPEPFSHSYVIPVSNGDVTDDVYAVSQQVPASRSQWFRDDNVDNAAVTEITLNLTPVLDSMCVIFVTSVGGEASISGQPSGWGRGATFIPTGTHINATVYYGPVPKTGATIKFTSSTASSRLHASARCFFGNPTLYFPSALSINGLSSSTYTPSTPTGGYKRYYILASVHETNYAFSVEIDTSGGAIEQHNKSGILECYPYANGDTVAPTFGFAGVGINPSDMVFVGVNLVE